MRGEKTKDSKSSFTRVPEVLWALLVREVVQGRDAALEERWLLGPEGGGGGKGIVLCLGKDTIFNTLMRTLAQTTTLLLPTTKLIYFYNSSLSPGVIPPPSSSNAFVGPISRPAPGCL